MKQNKDRRIIDNYTGHNSRLKDKIADLEDESRNVRYCNATLRDEKAKLESRIHNLRDRVRERNTELQQELEDWKENAAAADWAVGELRKKLNDSRKAFADLMDERNEYQKTLCTERIDHTAEKRAINQFHNATNKELRAKNLKLRRDIDLHNLCFAIDPAHCNNIPIPTYGMRSLNFEHLIKGYHGTLSRHGKTIIITLPFEHENVARNAEKYIVGLED